MMLIKFHISVQTKKFKYFFNQIQGTNEINKPREISFIISHFNTEVGVENVILHKSIG